MRAERRETVEVDGHRVGLTVRGDGSPLVLLHGIGRDRDDWCAVVADLAAEHRVYALDLEGFGESEPWGAAVSLRSMARVVRQALIATGEHRPVAVVGNSLGGAVALRLHADDPAGVAALVLISPAGFGREAVVGLRLLTVPVLGSVLLTLDSLPGVVRLRGLLDRDALTRRLAAEASARLRRRGMKRGYLQVIHDLGAWSGIREPWRQEVLEALAAAGTPALVLWGDRDAVLPYAHLAAVAATVPHAEAVPLPGLGHMPQLEQPERIAGLVEDFLARTSRTEAAV